MMMAFGNHEANCGYDDDFDDDDVDVDDDIEEW